MKDDEFLRRYEEAKPVLYSICYNFGGKHGQDQVDEYMQEALVKLWVRKDMYKYEDTFTGWAATVTRNTILSLIRRSSKMYEILDKISDRQMYRPDPVPLPDEVYEAKEDHQELMAHLGDLNPVYRDVIIMYHLKGMAYKEMAERLDVSIGTVMSRLYRGRKALGINPRGE